MNINTLLKRMILALIKIWKLYLQLSNTGYKYGLCQHQN